MIRLKCNLAYQHIDNRKRPSMEQNNTKYEIRAKVWQQFLVDNNFGARESAFVCRKSARYSFQTDSV